MATVAFFTLNAYDMLSSSEGDDTVGGAQLQQILIGEELSKRGHEVYFVEYDARHKVERTIRGISIVLKPRPGGSEPRRAATAIVGTGKALRIIDPDVCYRRVLNFEIFPLSVYCSLTGTRFIYGLAHDDELGEDPHQFSHGIKSTRPYKWLNMKALSAADAIVAQNDLQYDLATRRFDSRVEKIANCYEQGDPDPIPELVDCVDPVVLWVARFTDFKRPEVVLSVADELPGFRFVMIGTPDDRELYDRVEAGAEQRPNVTLEGFVPYSAIDRFFVSADLFLNTSRQEGFPNTFLQSWAYGIPVVSLSVDPDGILSTRGIGVVGNDSVDELVGILRDLGRDRARRESMGRRAREYFLENHTVESITDKFETVLVPE